MRGTNLYRGKTMNDNTHTIAPEVAEEEFDNWVDAMDIDGDTDLMDSEDRKAFDRQKKRIVKAIMRGSLTFNDEGYAVYTPQHPKSKYEGAITFHERTGASLMATDGKKDNYDVTKTYAIMADMTKLPAKTFAGLAGSDIKVCEALYALLMD